MTDTIENKKEKRRSLLLQATMAAAIGLVVITSSIGATFSVLNYEKTTSCCTQNCPTSQADHHKIDQIKRDLEQNNKILEENGHQLAEYLEALERARSSTLYIALDVIRCLGEVADAAKRSDKKQLLELKTQKPCGPVLASIGKLPM